MANNTPVEFKEEFEPQQYRIKKVDIGKLVSLLMKYVGIKNTRIANYLLVAVSLIMIVISIFLFSIAFGGP